MDTYSLCSFTFFFIPFIFVTHTALSVKICPPSSCSKYGPEVRFPFRLTGQQPHRCGYLGFDLSCNNQSQTILTLPGPAQFTVSRIDYAAQSIYINDPDFCLPEKILKFDLSGTPYITAFLRSYTFFNCSSSEASENEIVGAVWLPCLSGDGYTVFAISPYWFSQETVPVSCRNISTVSVPQLSFSPYWAFMDPINDLQLTWVAPECSICESNGGTCGYESDNGPQIACSKAPTQGLPRSGKYGIIIGIGIPGLVCIIGLTCYISSKIRDDDRPRHLNTELPTITIPPQPLIMSGLDGRTIASFPKTVVGESRRLPKFNDSICPICLSEYQFKETLKTIPECNHYFHSDCIDEWLRLNATCPLCRNSPDSSTVTPSSSMSSASSLASSS